MSTLTNLASRINAWEREHGVVHHAARARYHRFAQAQILTGGAKLRSKKNTSAKWQRSRGRDGRLIRSGNSRLIRSGNSRLIRSGNSRLIRTPGNPNRGTTSNQDDTFDDIFLHDNPFGIDSGALEHGYVGKGEMVQEGEFIADKITQDVLDYGLDDINKITQEVLDYGIDDIDGKGKQKNHCTGLLKNSKKDKDGCTKTEGCEWIPGSKSQKGKCVAVIDRIDDMLYELDAHGPNTQRPSLSIRPEPNTHLSKQAANEEQDRAEMAEFLSTVSFDSDSSE